MEHAHDVLGGRAVEVDDGGLLEGVGFGEGDDAATGVSSSSIGSSDVSPFEALPLGFWAEGGIYESPHFSFSSSWINSM